MSRQKSMPVDKLIFRLFLALMPAAIVIMLSSSLNSIVDGIIASNYIGDEAIAAIGYYTPFVSLLIGISGTFSGGSLIIVGNKMGKGDEIAANKVFTTGVLITACVFSFISIFLFCFAPWAAVVLGADGVVKGAVVSYIRGVSFSFLPVYLGNHLGQFLELEQRHIRNYLAVGVMLISNLVFNLVFVKYFRLGCLGLGLATTVASVLYFLILIQYYFTKKSQLVFELSLFDISLIKSIVVIGLPGALLQIYLCIRGYVYNQAIEHYAGAEGMAAFAAANSFSCIFFAFSFGISTASKTLFSIFVGAQDRESIKSILRLGLFRFFPANILLSCVFCGLSTVFTGIYFKDTATVTYGLAIELFKIVPFAVCFSTVGGIFSALFQCEGRMKIVNIISMVDGLLGVCLSMLLLCPGGKINGVWFSWFTNNLFVMAVIAVYILGHLKRWPRCFEDILVLDEDFGASEDIRLNLSILNKEDVVGCSDLVIKFLKGRGVNHKKAFYAGLALEEMAGNIIEHGYTRDNKNHSAVIECIDFTDRLVLHIMDDCEGFNPLSKELIFDPEDPTKNIGIRLVQKLADDIKYYRMIGLNVLTITIT